MFQHTVPALHAYGSVQQQLPGQPLLNCLCAVPYERQYCRTLGNMYDQDPYSCTHMGTIQLEPSGCVWRSEPWSSRQSQIEALWMGTSTVDKFIQQFEALTDESELDEVALTHLFEHGLHCLVTEKIYGVEVMPKTLPPALTTNTVNSEHSQRTPLAHATPLEPLAISHPPSYAVM